MPSRLCYSGPLCLFLLACAAHLRPGWIGALSAQTLGTSLAVEAWQLGQDALEKDDFDGAIGQFQLSLRIDPTLARSHLSLAAAYLARGEDALALSHLDKYVNACPKHLSVRAHYAELLFKARKPLQARVQFEKYVESAQGAGPQAEEHLIHCHTRLMEIADAQDDEYESHLHRGIGLYHLACRRAELGGEDGRETAEGLLCKSAADLTLARLAKPDLVRPAYYLYCVWDRLAQRHPARRWLRTASQADDLVSDLTPTERLRLREAVAKCEEDDRRK